MNLRALAFLGLSLVSTAFAGSAQAANPFGLAYSQTTNVSLYGKPTGILVTGRCNRYNSAFASARSKGAEILAYINAIERPDHKICDLDYAFYMNNIGAVPLWPYPSYGQRYAWPGMNLTDMRPGSKWILWVVSLHREADARAEGGRRVARRDRCAPMGLLRMDDLVDDREEPLDRR